MNSRQFFSYAILVLALVVGRNLGKAQQANLPSELIAYADTVLYNGQILTADDNFTIAEAVAIRDGKFLAIGAADRILPMAGPQTHKIDLRGKTVIPGLIDLHQHPFGEGMSSYWAKKWFPDPRAWETPQEALEAIAGAVAKAKPGEAIVISRVAIGATTQGGAGSGLSNCDFLTPEAKYDSPFPCAVRAIGNICRVITRAQLDSVSPHNPVVFVAIADLAPEAMNSKAAEVIQPHLPADMSPFETENGICVKEGGTGRSLARDLTRVYVPKLVKDYVMFWQEPFENTLEAFRLGMRGANSAGITLTKEHTAMELMGGITELWSRGELTVRMRLPFPLTPMNAVGNETTTTPQQAETLFRSIGNMGGIGDDMLRLVGVRATAIGGLLGTGTAWMLEPKRRPAQTGNFDRAISPYGGPGMGPGGAAEGPEIFEGRTNIVQAVRFGWDVGADHTVGDRAVHEVLNAFEEGLQTQIVKRPGQRLTINHTLAISPQDIERANRLGVFISIGPWQLFETNMLEFGVSAYGREGVLKMLPIGSYVSRGMKPALEGDSSVSPFWRIEKAVTRKDDRYGRVWNNSETISRKEALWMSTRWPPYAIGEQDKLGSIEAGKLADLVVLSGDFMTVPEDQIHLLRALMTMVGGKVVYERAGQNF